MRKEPGPAKMKFGLVLLVSLIGLLGCSEESKKPAVSASAARYLYIASGACYSGSNTTFTNLTSSNQVYRVDLSTGIPDTVIADYFRSPSSPGDSPVGIGQLETGSIYVAVENSTTASLRRIERIEKKYAGSRTTISNNITALNSQLRNLLLLPSGDFMVSKSTAIEYITSANARVGAPFISASAAPCNTSTTLVTKTLRLGNGKYVFLHAAAAQNRFGIFAPGGGTICLAAQAAPVATAFPTAAFYDSVNMKLFVAYAGNSTASDINSIYMYSINETTNAISGATKIYDAANYPGSHSYLLYGISEMAYDPVTSTVFIATAINTATTIVNYNIEKFTYNPTQIGVDNTKILERSGTTPFIPYNNDTKCISQMLVAE